MYPLGVVVAIALVIGLIVAYKSRVEYGDGLFVCLIYLLISGAFGFCFGLLVALMVGNLLPRDCYPNESIGLAAIRNGGQSVSGTFFLGSGSIGSTEYYFYYQKLDENTFRPGKVLAHEVSAIHEDERSDALMKIWQCRVDNRYNNWGFGPISYQYEFFVPDGTVLRGYHMQ